MSVDLEFFHVRAYVSAYWSLYYAVPVEFDGGEFSNGSFYSVLLVYQVSSCGEADTVCLIFLFLCQRPPIHMYIFSLGVSLSCLNKIVCVAFLIKTLI